MSIYMKINGIQGDSTSKDYQGWIMLHTADFNVDKPVNMSIGRMTSALDDPTISKFKLSKQIDSASPKLFEASLNNQPLNEVLIHLCKTQDEQTKAYLEYRLQGVFITHYHTAALSDGKYTEASHEDIHLSFSQIDMRHISLEGNKSPKAVTFDLARNKFL